LDASFPTVWQQVVDLRHRRLHLTGRIDICQSILAKSASIFTEPSPDAYGELRIDAYTIDNSNGEFGRE
jgi:hypothetical protein